MKKFSLKKITAAVSAAAMIATMGTSASAADPATGTISIDKVEYDTTKSTGNIHAFKIHYTTSVTQELGVTMFSYMKSTDTSALTDDVRYTEETKGSLKIVGVDQKADGTDKTIDLVVSTNSKDSINVADGQIGLVLLGGDKVSAPAVALIATPGISLNKTDLGRIPVLYTGNTTAENEALKSAILDKLLATDENGADIKVTTYDSADNNKMKIAETPSRDSITVDLEKNTVTVGDFYKTIVYTMSYDKFFATSAAVNLTGSLPMAMKDSEGTAYTADTFKAAVLDALIKGGHIVLKNEDDKTLTLSDAEKNKVAISLKEGTTDFEPSATGEQEITYQITVDKSLTITKDGETVAWFGDGATGSTDAIDVTVKASNNGFVADTIEAYKSDNTKLKEVSYKNGEKTFDQVKADITGQIAKVMLTSTTEEGKQDQWKVDEDGTWDDGGYTSTPTDDATYQVKVPIVSDDSESVDHSTPASPKPELGSYVLITVKVAKPAPAFTYGDVNGDGKIDISDYGLIKRYSLHKIDKFTATDGSIIPNEAADVSGDGKIDISDYGLIKRYSLHKISSFPAEEGK